MSFHHSGFGSQKPVENTQRNDYDFPTQFVPRDGISNLSINGTKGQITTLCVAASWDSTISAYEIQQSQSGFNAIKQSEQRAEGPILCTTISDDGYSILYGGIDRTLRMWDVRAQNSTPQTIGTHDGPIKVVQKVPGANIYITAGWDKQVKVWDPRQSQAVLMQTLPERIYAMDANNRMLVCGTAGRQCHVFDISGGSLRNVASFEVLKYQTRCISLFADGNGFAVGSIEGRVGLEYFDEIPKKQQQQKPPSSKNFVFKCHREKISGDRSRIFAVNSIDFHPLYNTLCTAGSDGVFCMWDKDARHRLGIYQDFKYGSNTYHNPITSAKISPQDNLLFYSMSYDWSMGANPQYQNNSGINQQNRIMIHRFDDADVKPKGSK